MASTVIKNPVEAAGSIGIVFQERARRPATLYENLNFMACYACRRH